MTEDELLAVALSSARGAAEVHRRYLGRIRSDEWGEKGIADFVTRVDMEAEERIVAEVRDHFPDHAILAEEGTATAAWPAEGDGSEPEWVWVVDPLDGTTNFLHGYPMYAASVAVLHRGAPVAGAVVSAATGEEWTAVRGGGAFRNGERIGVSAIDRLPRALIGTGFPFKAHELLPAYLHQFDAVLRRTAGIRRAGSAAIDLCYVAAGLLDGFWELDLAPWDYAAGALIVREAGGVASTPTGAALDARGRGGVLAGNPIIHAALLDVLAAVQYSSS
ncbi:MAG TPA: inositol monophosphatase family protein [Longimicrobiales bacterium]